MILLIGMPTVGKTECVKTYVGPQEVIDLDKLIADQFGSLKPDWKQDEDLVNHVYKMIQELKTSKDSNDVLLSNFILPDMILDTFDRLYVVIRNPKVALDIDRARDVLSDLDVIKNNFSVADYVKMFNDYLSIRDYSITIVLTTNRYLSDIIESITDNKTEMEILNIK